MHLLIVLRLRRLDIVATYLDSLLFTSSDLPDLLAFVAIREKRCVALGNVLKCSVVFTSRIEYIERVSQIRCVLLRLLSLLKVEQMIGNFSSAYCTRLFVRLLSA